jgi:hypothetical protein
MRSVRYTRWLASAVAALALSGPAAADELTMRSAPAADPAGRPARGMSMERVEATFGAPSKRVPAVGEPPISRWEYPGFVVYFENQLVIHSVASG